ncbi:LytTR family transcriptional regulator DNA-binding domain-containing protein [Bacillus carboniphilus]|uniref:LytTR family transcriptional regulator DNA-binding domain-containing protein n=1 Tax=Bacillus carboniphilus TaxID=86663 RepID=A0ABY9JWZ8_9BACI|nr:LytTR family transcriptional regulator DNA-binding domain-containing protein [Bacillus carboniphilus]WLR42140.1 LytTR family transcriptional regulator DNA-binding domain-containing protein [Bacillus carboniphilus]
MVLKIINLEKHEKDTTVFSSFNLEINNGDSVSLHTNTSVRNSLINILIGKEAVSVGQIHINNEKISINLHSVSFLLLKEALYERLTVMDHFKFFKRLYQSPHSIESILSIVKLDEKKLKKVKNLSPSEKRRVQYGRTLFHDACLYVFEEPVQNVDIESKEVFVRLITWLEEKKKGILVLTDNKENARTLTNKAYHLDKEGLKPILIESDDVKEEENEKPLHYAFNKLPMKINKKIVLFDPTDITFIESCEGSVNVHINGEEFEGVFTLIEFEQKLQPFGFFRCHRSYIVNLQKVKEIITWTKNSYSLIMEDQSEVPLSKAKMAVLKEIIGVK